MKGDESDLLADGSLPIRPPEPIPVEPSATPRVKRIVRCPECGSTDAGAIDHFYEIIHMLCRGCGHRSYVDDMQLGDDWNIDFEIPAGASEIPSHVAPLEKSKA